MQITECLRISTQLGLGILWIKDRFTIFDAFNEIMRLRL